MAKVKVSMLDGSIKEVEIELHVPVGPQSDWQVLVGHEVVLSPEHFAHEMESDNSAWSFTAPHLVEVDPAKHEAASESAARFQRARVRVLASMGKRSIRGRPFAHNFSRAEDFAVTVLHLESLGHRYSTHEALAYWDRHGQRPPALRQIEESLRVVRTWVIPDLESMAKAVRRRYRLKKPPTKIRGKKLN